MKRILVIGIFIFFMSFLSGILTDAQALDANAVFQQLKTELLSKGMASTDITVAAQPIKDMLGLGANQADVKSVLLDLMSKGFKGNDFGSLVSLVSDLMKSGTAIKGASGFVSQAIQQASSLGLKGKDLIAKVQGIVSQKIAQLGQLKSNVAGGKEQVTSEVDKTKKSLGSILGNK
jgi:hypothetical protein